MIKPKLVQVVAIATAALMLAGCTTTTRLSMSSRRPARRTTYYRPPPPISPAGVANQVVPGNDQPPLDAGRIVYFDFDKYDVKPEYHGVIEYQARYLRSHPGSHVTLEGNTDIRGSHEYNLALGQRRAEAVQRELTMMGIPVSQIESVSFGMENPADPSHNEEAYAKNRRVEFHYR